MSVPPPPPRRRNAPDVDSGPGAAPPPPPRPDLEARAARRAEQKSTSQRRWWLTVVAGVLAIALIAVVAVVVMGGDDKKKEGPKFEASTAVDLKVGNLDIVSPQSTGSFPPELADQLISVIGKYVDDGIVTPLRKGKADDQKMAALFDLAANNRLAGDRVALLDEGFPKAVGKIKITAPPVNFLALASGPAILLVTAAIDLKIRARLATGTATIHRVGTLVFAKQQSGDWLITGWTLHVDRAGPGVEVTTTTAPATTTTAAPG